MLQRWLEIDPKKSALVIGPRRSGKTTFLKQLFPDYPYSTLDDLDAYQWALQDPKGFITSLGPRAIIDEIQRVPHLTIAVKYAIDNQNALFFMTGSSSIGLLDSASDSLAGRINLYHFSTLCWGEEVDKEPHSLLDPLPVNTLKEALRNLPQLLKYGSFPEVVIEKNAQAKAQLLRNYKNTYFTRDLMQLANLENIEGIMGVYQHLIRSIGSPIEVSNVGREAGISFPSAKKYLNALLQSGLTFRLYGYQYGPAKRYIKAAKTYFSDNGIIDSFNTELSEGQRLENFVIAELEKRRKLGYIQTDAFYYYKSQQGKEIDVLFQTDHSLYAIEIKLSKTPGPRDYRNLLEFGKGLKKTCCLILFYTGDNYFKEQDIHVIPIASLYTLGPLTKN